MAHQSGITKDFFPLLFLFGATLLIYYPVFYTEYAYTDELVGLWQWNNGNADSTNTLFLYGRYITAKLAAWLFGTSATIGGLSGIRVFSLLGWMCCLPAWYFILKSITRKENLPEMLSFFSVLYLVCTPSFAISVGWAACFEMFIANTLGLVSGYFLYTGIKQENKRTRITVICFLISLLAGILCLFVYQNCFGCFLLPFLLHLINSRKITKELITGVVVYFIIYIVYYLLFRYSLIANHIDTSDRTAIHINVGNKLPYFFARPLASSFHFTYLFNEKSITGLLVYALIAAVWFWFAFLSLKTMSLPKKVKYFATVLCMLGLVFLPSLIVKENYASNRTLFALRLAVFFLAASTIMANINSVRTRDITVIMLSVFFCANAWYNFNKQFLHPVKHEYNAIRSFVENNYKTSTDTVFFIRPAESFFMEKYGITRSWDEFGVPSTFFEWTPPFLVRQIVFEKTGDRIRADKLVIKNITGVDSVLRADSLLSPHLLLMDAERIINRPD